MRRLQIALVVAFVATVVLAGVVVARSWAELNLSWHVIASGGGRSASGSSVVTGSMGQPVVGAAQSSGYRLGAGFWYGVREPAPPTPTPTSTTPPTGAHRLYLPVLVKGH